MIKSAGEIRGPFHHCIDVVPTILDYLGIDAPTTVNGVEQEPIHGQSMRSGIEDPASITPKRAQYFEMLGDRGIWADGWKAVTRHSKGKPFDKDIWELYHLESDFSEFHNLAEKNPDKLREMIDLWWIEAGKYDVLPLDDRDRERSASTLRAAARERYRYYPGTVSYTHLTLPTKVRV